MALLPKRAFRRPGHGILPGAHGAGAYLVLAMEETPVFCLSLPYEAAKGQWGTHGSAASCSPELRTGGSPKKEQELSPGASQS